MLPARFVVGADGLKSSVRQSAGLDRVVSEKRRYGLTALSSGALV